jgi:uncharacterized protein
MKFPYNVDGKKYTFDSVTGDIYPLVGNLTNDIPEDRLSRENLPVRNILGITKEAWFDSRVLNKMSLSLAHDCNMSCKYCFAGGGTYGYRDRMSKDMAKENIDYFFKYASKDAERYSINFIGGEPLINKEVFLYSLKYMNEYSKLFSIPIHYIITTNGTIMDHDILDAIIENDIYVNLSLDGGRETHDLNRKYINGKGTFDKAIETLKTFYNNQYYNVSARVTMTKPGVPFFYDDMMQLWDLDIYHIFVDMVETDNESLKFDRDTLKLFKQQLNLLFDSGEIKNRIKENKFLRNFLDIYGLIKNRHIKTECAYFNTNTLHLTPNGDMYKCSFTVGDKQSCIGNIHTSLQWDRFREGFEAPDQCHKCWARRICGGGCYLSRDELHCEYSKIMAEGSLKFYSLLETNDRMEGANV